MSEKFDVSLYNDEFFEWHHTYTRDYQRNTFNWYLDNYVTNSVIDFGCGIGTYIETAYDKGIGRLAGFDIGLRHALKYIPRHVQQYLMEIDCTNQMTFGQKYDCVISFETAEHINPSGTDGFVANLIKASNGTILFTAAPPGQLGCGHINLHEKQFWIDKFNVIGHGYIKHNVELTDTISNKWREIGCPSYISDNLIVLQTNKLL